MIFQVDRQHGEAEWGFSKAWSCRVKTKLVAKYGRNDTKDDEAEFITSLETEETIPMNKNRDIHISHFNY